MISNVKINDQELLRYSLSKIENRENIKVEEVFDEGDYICFGQYLQDQPYWIVTLYDFTTQGDCLLDITLNIKGLLSVDTFHRIAKIVGEYAFNQADRTRVSTQVRASNKNSIRITKAFGFQVEGLVRKGYNLPIIEDKILFGMLKEECPWI